MSKKLKIRNNFVNVGGISLSLPCFFPSISSIKTNLTPLEYLKVIIALKHPLFLISAYDLYNCSHKNRCELKKLIQVSINGKQIVLVDSGNYESYWRRDNCWSINKYREILTAIPHHVAFCYDILEWNAGEHTIVNRIEQEVIASQKHSSGTILPIVHSPKNALPRIVPRVAKKINPLFLAVPERQLGDGIVERATTIFKIRNELNKLGVYYPLHLLGTGNPLSILIYSVCGADSFDGLEWCQTTVDHKTGLLHHFQQREFFRLDLTFKKLDSLPYSQLTLAHNINFYCRWMDKIRAELSNGKIDTLLKQYLPRHILKLLKKELPKVF